MSTAPVAVESAWRMILGLARGHSAAEGVALLRAAAARGEAEAHARLALLQAFGVAVPADLPAAVEHLRAAAQAGSAAAANELAVLAAVPAAALARDVSDRPWIRTLEGFATPAECRWLIETGRSGLARAKVYRDDAAGHKVAESRTGADSDYTISRASVVLARIRERIQAALGLPASQFEVAKLLHYEPDQQFSLHADFQDPAVPALACEIAQRGQRVATFLIYLNEDYEGGETEFPDVPFRYRGRCGDALMFRNVLSDGAPDHSSRHAGLPPLGGEKWLFSQWVRSRPVG